MDVQLFQKAWSAVVLRKWLPARVNYFVDGFLLAVLFGFGAYVGHAFVSRDPPVKVLAYNILSFAPNPMRGEQFSYEVTFIRTKWCDTKVNRWFVDSKKRTVPQESVLFSMDTSGGLFHPQKTVTYVWLPITLMSGRTEWCFFAEWKCNWTQNDYFPPGPIIGDEKCLTFWVNNPGVPVEDASLDTPVQDQ